jgi:glycosyltransferase involved in cell wall biosynthesis
MNILMLCEGDAESWDSWSGISKSIVDQLRAQGHTVHVGDIDLYGVGRCAAAAATFSPDRRNWTSRYHLGAVPFRLRSMKARRHVTAHRDRIDVILQVGATCQPLGRRGIPYCLCCDSNIRMAQHGASSGFSDGTALTGTALQAIAQREYTVYGQAAAIFTLSERLRRSFIDDFGIPADRVRAMYAGPNLDLSRVPTVARPRGVDDPPTVLFVGRQFHRKGGDALVESVRRIRTRLPNTQLIVAGPPAGYIDEPGMTCVGNLDKNKPDEWAQLVSAYASADVFVLPTRFEPFGIAFVEAMHFGLPCIGPRAWAVPEIIADGETGFTVPVDDVDALTDRLLLLLSTPTLARSMGEAGRERARRLFTWPQAVGRVAEVLQGIVSERGRAV